MTVEAATQSGVSFQTPEVDSEAIIVTGSRRLQGDKSFWASHSKKNGFKRLEKDFKKSMLGHNGGKSIWGFIEKHKSPSPSPSPPGPL